MPGEVPLTLGIIPANLTPECAYLDSMALHKYGIASEHDCGLGFGHQKIVYDPQTTSGNSGDPLFNDQGEVIATNFAMVRYFGGSEFPISVHFGKSLLKP